MLHDSIVRNSSLPSVLKASSAIRPHGETSKRSIVADLLLTALIDAFSILVIFLLMSFSSSGEILSMGKGMELPHAVAGEQLDRQPVIKIEEDKIFLESKEIAPSDLVASLLDLRKHFNDTRPGQEFPGILTIQGDRRLKYERLNSIVLASSQAGFSDIKFAVIMK